MLEGVLRGWDYAKEETFGMTLGIRPEELLSSTGQPRLSNLCVVLVADSRSAQRRISMRHRLPEEMKDSAVDFELRIPAGAMAESVRLTAHLAVWKDFDPEDRTVAHTLGARLASSPPTTLELEGKGSRFPVSPVKFSARNLPYAPWALQMDFADLNESFLSAVNLYVNREHPVGSALLDSNRVDQVVNLSKEHILRQLIARISGDDFTESLDGASFEDDSVGGVAEAMTQMFLNTSLASAVHLYKDDPLSFELLLHGELRPLDGVIS